MAMQAQLMSPQDALRPRLGVASSTLLSQGRPSRMARSVNTLALRVSARKKRHKLLLNGHQLGLFDAVLLHAWHRFQKRRTVARFMIAEVVGTAAGTGCGFGGRSHATRHLTNSATLMATIQPS